MKNNTVSLHDETYRLAHVAEGEREPELERRRRRLDEFFADLDARRLGLRASDRLTRNELYDEAINGPDAIWT